MSLDHGSSEPSTRERPLHQVVIQELADGAFLIAWVAIQYGVDRAIGLFDPDGFALAWLYVFQFLFGISTLSPILARTIRHIKEDFF